MLAGDGGADDGLAADAGGLSSRVSRDRRTVEARARPIRACPHGPASAATGRGSSIHGVPGSRMAGAGTLSALANAGT
ncbi:hypothetical protein, partial [Thermocatellispora tengchongensis]|uniref:hypothetical protein n=1 Tax=Thermocatellispora tengchongensis TaxID=1073253 RepID=UPI0031E64CEE